MGHFRSEFLTCNAQTQSSSVAGAATIFYPVGSEVGRLAVSSTQRLIAEANLIATWDEAIALHRALPRIRKQLKQAYKIENLQMQFINPRGGLAHTEFSLSVLQKVPRQRRRGRLQNGCGTLAGIS